MNAQNQRVKKFEEQIAMSKEEQDPLFLEWQGNPWMPEEEVEVLAQHPDCDCFFKGMMPRSLPDTPRGEQKKPILLTLNGTRYSAWKRTPEERKRQGNQDRTPNPVEEERRQKQIQRLRDYMNEVKGFPPRPDQEVKPSQFSQWSENYWTEEEKTEVLAKHPECDWFYKGAPPSGPLNGMDPKVCTLDGSPYLAEKKKPWITYSLEEARSNGYEG
jgi:hypothetical protein